MAARLYRGLNEKVKAIKCLIKLNDIEKIITFATNARVSEIYILAANYLQTTDWENNPEIMRTLISFY